MENELRMPPGTRPAPSTAPLHAAGERVLTASGIPDLQQVLADMLAILNGFLPTARSLPAANATVASVTERRVGLGNIRGDERRGAFAAVLLKGGRLEAVVRFQLWGDGPAQVDATMDQLHASLLAAKEQLFVQGFLRFVSESASLAEHASVLNAWRKTADYRVLYEYHYEDSDGAQSLIARIPIHSDPETRNSPARETTVVTDGMVRWDDQQAPRLVLRGRARVSNLAMLRFIPGAMPGGSVTLLRTCDGATGAPIDHGSLPQFLSAVQDGNAQRHAQVTFSALSDFIAAFEATGDTLTLGDWNLDNQPDLYTPLALTFDPPLWLPRSSDRFEVICGSTAFDQSAVVYLRANRRS